MPMNSDEHAEMLMRQNNRHLRWRGLVLVGIPVMLLAVIGIVMTINDPISGYGLIFLAFAVLLLITLVITRAELPRAARRGRILERLKQNPEFASRYAMTSEWVPHEAAERRPLEDEARYTSETFDEPEEKLKEKRKPKRY
jgi:hypothetical protein